MFREFSKIRDLGSSTPETQKPEIPFTSRDPRYAAYQIGAWTYGKPTVLAWGEEGLKIGKYCSIADGVTILLGGEHRPDWITTYPFTAVFSEIPLPPGHPKTKGPVVIENDVWIGQGAWILSGVHIGNGAVVGAGSVVTKDVAPYAIVAGNPARFIRDRFLPEQRDALLRIAWWNWPESRIQKALPILLSGKVDEFIRTQTERLPVEIS